MYFLNVTSFADLKLQYRQLALANHPDRGGETEVMQQINAEFDKLFLIWKDRKDAVSSNGYENDYSEATSSRQYAEYVWNEYNWKGVNCGKIPYSELPKHFREWCKKTYPNCKFSITKNPGGWHWSFSINLYQADFECFVDKDVTKAEYNHYWHSSDKELTPRCREVMKNVVDYIMSYNYDKSNSMVDYFDVGFYVDFKIGSYSKNFKYVPKQIKSSDKSYKRKVGPIQKMINQAMKGCKWAYQKRLNHQTHKWEDILDEPKILCLDNDANCAYAQYSNRREALQSAKVKSLSDIGILCHIKKSVIVFDGYAPLLKEALELEQYNI